MSLVEKLREEFPQKSLQVVHCPQVLGLNGKVSNLAQMLSQARFEHILINDSDILVEPDYLLRVMAPFAKPEVGMVTTLYRGLAGKTLGSKLEALGLSSDFAGGVLIARAMESGIRFGLGATIATTKTVLERLAVWSGWLTAWATIMNLAHARPRRDSRSNWRTRSRRPLCLTIRSATFGYTRCVGPGTLKIAVPLST